MMRQHRARELFYLAERNRLPAERVPCNRRGFNAAANRQVFHLGGCTNPAFSCHSRWRGIAPALTHLWTAIRETPKAFATAVCVPYFFNSCAGVMGGQDKLVNQC